MISIILTSPNSLLWRETIDFVADHYAKIFATKPSIPEFLFCAYSEEEQKIVGSIALDFGDAERPLPTERIFKINLKRLPNPLNRKEIAQYGRWIATAPNVSVVLAYAATDYALGAGKKYGWSELKPPIANRLKELGVECVCLEAELISANVSPNDRAYFLSGNMPGLYNIDLRQMRDAFWKIAKPLLDSGNFGIR